MTMLRKSLAVLAALALAGWAGQLQAADTPRLPDDVNAPTITLGGDIGSVDTELVAYRGGGYRGGGHSYGGRGGYYGGRGGYYGGRGGYYGGYRGYYGGYRGYYRPYAGVGYYGGYYSRYYYPGYAYYAPYCNYSLYTYPTYYYPDPAASYAGYYALTGVGQQETQTPPYNALPQVPAYPGVQPGTIQPGPAAPYMPQAPGDPGNGTFDYNGGPGGPVPLPGSLQQAPISNPPAAKGAADGRLVSVPGKAQSSGFAFPAYGEQSSTRTPSPQSPAVTPVSLSGAGFAFPAYGEQRQTKPTGFAANR
jgi:hypothetical protein